MKLISIVIPCYNEEENIDAMYESLRSLAVSQPTIDGAEMNLAEYAWEWIFVNDGSSDETKQRVLRLHENDSRVRLVSLSRNFGKENAMLAGLDRSRGDAVIIMDADLQHPVSVIPQMLQLWEQGYQDVYGQRTTRGSETCLHKWMTLRYYALLDSVGDTPTLPNVGDFRLLDRKAVDALIALRETQRYTKGLYCWIGFKKKGVPYETARRNAGKSSFGPSRLLRLAMDGLTGYTTMPLRMASVVGLLVSLAAFAYMIFIVVRTILYGEPVTGFPTLACLILLLGGMQLLALGIIGEYIARIYNETKRRPPYIVEEATE